jgi:predicted nucleic acid-binding protein
MRVFLDANVLFSASLLERGNAPLLIAVGKAGGCRLLASPIALREAERNLSRKAPHALARFADVQAAVEIVPDAGADLLIWAEAEGLPSKDAPILAAAVMARADLLVTGDRRHFGPLFGRTLRGVRILPLVSGLAAVMDAAERNQV